MICQQLIQDMRNGQVTEPEIIEGFLAVGWKRTTRDLETGTPVEACFVA